MGVKIKHPLYDQTFELQPDGLIRVDDFTAGTYGLFERNGRPVSGTMTHADPEMLQWVGGKPQPPSASESSNA